MVLKAQVSCSNISLAYEMCKTMEIELRYTLRKANEMEDSKQEMVRIKLYVGLMNDDVNFLLFVFFFFCLCLCCWIYALYQQNRLYPLVLPLLKFIVVV